LRLKVNGQDIETTSSNIMQLLHEMDIKPERVAVEVNLKVIRRTEFERRPLYDGDVVEIVFFVGGGNIGR
jgi:thiamine biosynthesis protein ThiS